MESAAVTNLDRIREYRQRVQRNPDPLAYALLAEAFREEAMLAEAEDACRQGLEAYPTYITTRIILGQILEERDDTTGAHREFGMALAQDPSNMIARTALGRLLIQQGRMSEAAQHLEQVLFLNPADQSARELLDVAQGKQEPSRPEQVEVFVPPPEEEPAVAVEEPAPAPARFAAPAPAPPPVATVAADVHSVLRGLAELDGVAGAMLVAEDGVPVASAMGRDVSEELFGALVSEMWKTAAKYMDKMRLGRLKRGTIDGSKGVMVVIGMGPNALVVATELGARLGLVSFHAERARDTLQRL
jgi:predicted regulator of Ras-like GTPase activity (Roadblock/LC7/MglB family)